jgi:hypothetical protein
MCAAGEVLAGHRVAGCHFAGWRATPANGRPMGTPANGRMWRPKRYGGGAGAVRCWSGGGLTWVAQSFDIEQLMKLAIWLWVQLPARCIDGAGTVRARRVPDVDCVSYWH